MIILQWKLLESKCNCQEKEKPNVIEKELQRSYKKMKMSEMIIRSKLKWAISKNEMINAILMINLLPK